MRGVLLPFLAVPNKLDPNQLTSKQIAPDKRTGAQSDADSRREGEREREEGVGQGPREAVEPLITLITLKEKKESVLM